MRRGRQQDLGGRDPVAQAVGEADRQGDLADRHRVQPYHRTAGQRFAQFGRHPPEALAETRPEFALRREERQINDREQEKKDVIKEPHKNRLLSR
jgi:hypothetical protein